MNVPIHHGHHIVLNPVTVSFIFAANNNLNSHIIAVTSRERIFAVGLLEGPPNPMDGHFPELGSH